MNAGYVRLSRDDDKRSYVSIENQKLIINQYAASKNIVIDRWYEDDGISGYKFDRPGFQQMMADLNKDLDTVLVKDFSRLGRHNAKVLLLLDEFQERGKHLIVIDDNYDSFTPDDDIIGIKTWYNEKYVKDTSKKIRRVLRARQKEGTLLTCVPFGYKRNDKKKEIIEIVPNEAEQIKQIYELYMQGFGYRKIATYLTENLVPTPSAVRHERELAEGKHSNWQVVPEWSDSMVKNILDNDFYIGTYRLHKRARTTVHGKDKRIPTEKQYIFENHHPAIIDKSSFELVQDIKVKRAKTNYRGRRRKCSKTKIHHPFGTCLFCKDCGNRLTPVIRMTSKGERKYYICSTYNSKGKRYCPKAHLIEENALMNDVINYIRLCRNTLCETIADYHLKDFESEKKSIEEKRLEISKMMNGQKKQLKALFAQKIKDLASDAKNEDLITESYLALQEDILAHIHLLEMQLQELPKTERKTPDGKHPWTTALEVLDEIIENGILDRKDIEILIERIAVDENGFPDIILKYNLSDLITDRPASELNKKENEIILSTMKLIYEDDRGFTSAKYLSSKLTEAGYPKSRRSVLPYIHLMRDQGFIESTDNSLKPYLIIKSKKELKELIESFQTNISSGAEWEQNLHGNAVNRWYAGDDL
ncbi:MAG: recombinase family protein [Lachnospiraceae bacterium]|nr:recombinase family protein [Lachnospiraceae bacterium]